MKTKAYVYLIGVVLLISQACSLDESSEIADTVDENLKSSKNSTARSTGAVQFSGIGFFATLEECDYVSQGADFALHLTGDFEGCLFSTVEFYGCSPSGTYRETGTEYFVGYYKGEFGTFRTRYRFTSKYEGCSEDGFFLGAEIFGRCQHPLIEGSGTGVFAGATGRIDFKDDIEAGNAPYRGHLRY